MELRESGIVLYAKKSGLTSFSSLWAIKKALKTKKVGHTGTLDSFADGLLVVLTGSMTRLVEHITNFDKTYEAIFCFGTQTDTLDPTGTVIATGPLPSKKMIENAMLNFIGEIQQVPPVYSAIHIDGKRASDIARSGEVPIIKSRKITIHENLLLETDSDTQVHYAHIKVRVSKGTYIRSLARDIGLSCSSCAHVVALRRTSVGPFFLNDACFAQDLRPFSIAMLTNPDNQNSTLCRNREEEHDSIRDSLIGMNEQVAHQCGFYSLVLKNEFQYDFFNGKPLQKYFFSSVLQEGASAVFTEESIFCGLIKNNLDKISYSFVIPLKQKNILSSKETDV